MMQIIIESCDEHHLIDMMTIIAISLTRDIFLRIMIFICESNQHFNRYFSALYY